MAQNNLPQESSSATTLTNPDQLGVIKRGYTTIAVTTAETAGYSGAASIDLTPYISDQNVNLIAKVWEYTDGTPSGYYVLNECPYTEHYASNSYQTYLTRTVTVRLDNNVLNTGELLLGIYSWSLTQRASVRYYYVIYSTSIALGNLYSNPSGDDASP